MTPKPLTKEEFENIKLGKHWDLGGRDRDDFIGRVLAAEAFWREAVKNIDAPACPFCELAVIDAFWKDPAFVELSHVPGCPWLLAQEAE